MAKKELNGKQFIAMYNHIIESWLVSNTDKTRRISIQNAYMLKHKENHAHLQTHSNLRDDHQRHFWTILSLGYTKIALNTLLKKKSFIYYIEIYGDY